MRQAALSLIVLWLLVAAPAAHAAIVIEYETTNLPDAPGGGDRWEYRYFVSGMSFAANQGFSIWFAPELFRQLTDPVTPAADWNAIVLQPDLLLPAPGAFDTVAVTTAAAPASPFSVRFSFLGGTPGSQPFDVNQFDSAGNLVGVVATGFTVPRAPIPMPEPAVVTLSVAGVLLLVLGSRSVRPRG